ncbi:hypothetical protein K450DRAFT_256340 [Umbelopsis ramanniana AG]|uniref:Ubiquitin-activating enzyme E1-like n=1 Tax=Umbelopsis ramanniana AG TaxID=1314678 RepID=A0AAD5E583_UMBRA|nr:uncharacterized protein K450DRAFT_256340 [Umbelopsis ramanniana AG]KAI8576590.1 hypothetical protein K450DRAFT_256340 [Umbelopsis ramanniana AG]
MSRESNNIAVLGQTLHQRVASSRVLMVGAGGIGCELLKNLVLSGFKNIEVVDLDTIDLSNLNRQFLFQKQHIKKSKAHVAKESALKFNPAANITSHHANIKDKEFSVEWFKGFDLVLNALDNLDARRHVNMMCLAADVPLIESGTTGYLGQAYVIKKDVTECFDCTPKVTPTTYPVCTIRSTPSAPIHCIVWAKSYLFNQLFGNSEEEEEEAYQKETSDENAQEIEALARETEELRKIKEAMGSDEYGKAVFDKIFTGDIQRLLSMEDMWKNRTPPTPLYYDELAATMQAQMTSDVNGLKDQHTWNVRECFDMFVDSLTRLSTRLLDAKKDNPTNILVFDKDDNDAMDFVTAASNLRSTIFKIERKSRFDVKSMAGNIIPAIATTNAVIAGIVVMQAYKILNGQLSQTKRTYLKQVTRRPGLLVLEANSEPQADCAVCRTRNIGLKIDIHHTTLQSLLNNVVTASTETGGLGMSEEVTILEGDRLLYDIEFDDNAEKTLDALALEDGKILNIKDDEVDDDTGVNLVLQHATSVTLKNGASFELSGPTRPAIMEPESLGKRKREEGDEMANHAKRAALGNGSVPAASTSQADNGVIDLDDDETAIDEDGRTVKVWVLEDD